MMKKCPSADELSNVIETVKLAVDQSDFGPLFIYPDKNNVLNKQCNQLAWSVFSLLLAAMLQGIRIEFEGIRKEEITDDKDNT